MISYYPQSVRWYMYIASNYMEFGDKLWFASWLFLGLHFAQNNQSHYLWNCATNEVILILQFKIHYSLFKIWGTRVSRKFSLTIHTYYDRFFQEHVICTMFERKIVEEGRFFESKLVLEKHIRLKRVPEVLYF